MDGLMLSIYVTTFNHEKYIEKALDSVLMQKTEYKYEVLVGEDCSTDNTKKVLKEYEKKHLGKIVVFYREHNMNQEKITNAYDLKMRCRGKYIIALEGDDYWTDEYKIQKQISFLESHPEYVAVSHNCVIVDENSVANGEEYPECKDEEYSIRHFMSEIMPGQLTTVMCKNYMKYNYLNTELLTKRLVPGDRLLYFELATKGRVYCIQEVMSAYRHIVHKGSGFSANYKYDFKYMENWNYQMVKATDKDGDKSKKYAELLYLRNLMQGLKSRQCSIWEFVMYTKKINRKIYTFCFYIKSWTKQHIIKAKFWI